MLDDLTKVEYPSRQGYLFNKNKHISTLDNQIGKIKQDYQSLQQELAESELNMDQLQQNFTQLGAILCNINNN